MRLIVGGELNSSESNRHAQDAVPKFANELGRLTSTRVFHSQQVADTQRLSAHEAAHYVVSSYDSWILHVENLDARAYEFERSDAAIILDAVMYSPNSERIRSLYRKAQMRVPTARARLLTSAEEAQDFLLHAEQRRDIRLGRY